MRNKLILLKSADDFDKNKFRKIINSGSFRVRFAFSNQNSPRFGFIIPKKVVKKVTDRNKIKRRIKSILSAVQKNVRGADIIFFPNANSLKKRYIELESEIVAGIKNARLWKE